MRAFKDVKEFYAFQDMNCVFCDVQSCSLLDDTYEMWPDAAPPKQWRPVKGRSKYHCDAMEVPF